MHLEKNHLFEQIHAVLWERIRQGEIVPGQRLKDIEWARRLGVSRTPVREAMRKMQQEGVLIPLAQGGYEVRPTSRRDLIELYRCRAALEALATEGAAERFDEEKGKKLDDLVGRCDEAIATGDLDTAFSLNTAFHSVLIAESGNAHLKTLLESLGKLVFFYRTTLLKMSKSNPDDKMLYIERLRIKQNHHRAILAALKAKDAQRASGLMQAHVRATAGDLLPAIPETETGNLEERGAA